MVFFILGVSLAAPFITFVCAGEDVLSGTNKPTGLVIIALTAPSVVLKIVSLCFRQVSDVARIFIAAAFVLAGQLCVVFIPHLGGRFAGISFVSVGTGIGEVSVFLQASKELQEVALCSLIVGTSVGGVFGAVLYVGKFRSNFYSQCNNYHLYFINRPFSFGNLRAVVKLLATLNSKLKYSRSFLSLSSAPNIKKLGVSKTRGRGRGRGRGPLFFCFVFCCLALTKT